MTAIMAALISHHSDRTSDSDQSHSNESQQHLRSPLLSVSRGATALELVSNSSDKHLRVRSGSLNDFFGRGNFVFKFLRTFWQQRLFSFSFISSALTQGSASAANSAFMQQLNFNASSHLSTCVSTAAVPLAARFRNSTYASIVATPFQRRQI